MTAYSGLYDGVHGAPHSLIDGKNKVLRRVGRLLRGRGRGTVADTERLTTMVDATAHGTAAITHGRISGDDSDLGGVRTIDTITDVNETTDATDIVNTMDVIEESRAPTYVNDASLLENTSKAL